MPKSKQTKCSLLILFLIFISACSENFENVKTSDEAWGLSAPVLYSPSRSENRSFTEFKDIPLKEVAIDDVITFKEGPSSNITLLINSECTSSNRNSNRKLIQKVQTSLPSQISFTEFLPGEAWLGDLTNEHSEIICSVQFIARNSNGSEHSFELLNLPVKMSDVIPQLKVGTQFLSNEAAIKRIYLDELSKVYLDAKSGLKYHWVCPEFFAQTTAKLSGPISLDGFLAAKKDDSLLPGSLCRFIESDSQGLNIRFSNTFRVFVHRPNLIVDRNLNERLVMSPFPNGDQPLQQWTITNPTDESVFLALPKLKERTQVHMTVSSGRLNQGVGQQVSFRTGWQIFGATSKTMNEWTLLHIQRQSQAKIILKNISNFRCRNGIHGYTVVGLPDGTSLEALVLKDLESSIDEKNTVSPLELIDVKGRWVGATIKNESNQYKIQIPKDEISALPVNITNWQPNICRMLD